MRWRRRQYTRKKIPTWQTTTKIWWKTINSTKGTLPISPRFFGIENLFGTSEMTGTFSWRSVLNDEKLRLANPKVFAVLLMENQNDFNLQRIVHGYDCLQVNIHNDDKRSWNIPNRTKTTMIEVQKDTKLRQRVRDDASLPITETEKAQSNWNIVQNNFELACHSSMALK